MWALVGVVCFTSFFFWFDKLLDLITNNGNVDDRTPLLVGICGSIGSGKTTFARLLKQEYRYDELSFAQPLKKIAKIFGFQVDTQMDKKTIHSYWNISSRHFLRQWGTELCRHHLPKIIPEMSSIWIQHMEMKLNEIWNRSPQQRIVISDVRFIDEAALISKHGGILIRVVRPDAEPNDSRHESDKPIPDELIDHVIYNDMEPHHMIHQFNTFFGGF